MTKDIDLDALQAPSHNPIACPFCGCKEIFIEPDERGSGGQWVAPIHVGCKQCKAEQRGDDTAEAIAAWNCRAAPESADAARLDWLEAEINEHGAIHLHDGSKPYGHGLGLRPGYMRRTLRQAIDQARRAIRADGKEGEQA